MKNQTEKDICDFTTRTSVRPEKRTFLGVGSYLPYNVYHLSKNALVFWYLAWKASCVMSKKSGRSSYHTGICHYAWSHHWLIQLEQKALSDTVKSFKGKSAYLINKTMNRRGPVWQSGFYDHAVRHDEALVSIARYIVMNPVRAGLVKSVREYPLWDAGWSNWWSGYE